LPTNLPSPGTMIAGKYRIIRVLGRGGMGVVFAAQHEMLGEEVALKLMSAEAMQGEDAVPRFVNEARAAAKIKGEHVVRVLDVGVLDDGRPYIAMELMEGEDLGQLLRKNGPLPVPMVVDYLLQGMEAIAQAHARGVVHRDLKPSNFFLATQPDGGHIIKVLDFGIAKATMPGAVPFALTNTKAMMGSPLYMSPEQIRRSKEVAPQSDLWALGVITFELLTGRLPFDGETLGELFFAVVEQVPPLLHTIRPEISKEFSAVIACCLEKDRAKRYKTVVELALALRPFASPSGAAGVERVAAAFGRAWARSGGTPMSSPDVAAKATLPGTPPFVTESGPVLPPPASSGTALPTPPVAGRTNAAWTDSQAQAASTRPRWLIPTLAASAVVATAGALLGVLLLLHRSPAPASPSPGSNDTPAVEPVESVAPVATAPTANPALPAVEPAPPPTTPVFATPPSTGDLGALPPPAVAVAPSPAGSIRPPRAHAPAPAKPPASSSSSPTLMKNRDVF
jgi:eukaryotic-like serine/threonine-protein kinase